MKDFSGKRVLVTGGAKRVGAYIVRAFAQAGARVIVHCNTSASEAQTLIDSIGGTAAGHIVIPFDLSHPENIPDFIHLLPQDIDILVNNASIFRRARFSEESLEAGKAQFDLNFWGPVELMKLLSTYSTAPDFNIVNIADSAAAGTTADSFSYLLSKKALIEATRCAAKQLAPKIRVNAVAPGPMIPPPGLEHLKMAKTLPTLPLGRPVDPADLAEAVLFLAGNQSVTGSILFADCGQSLSSR